MEASTTRDERIRRLEDGLRVAMELSGGGNADMRRLLSKLRVIDHEYRADERGNRRLYVGAQVDRARWWEVRRSKAGAVYCKCPNHAFGRAKSGDACKHVVYAETLGLDVPSTADFV